MRAVTWMALVALTACGGDKDDDGTDHTDHDHDGDADTDADADSDTDTDTDADADADAELTVDLVFSAMFGDDPVVCGTDYPAPLGSTTVRFTDFRLYVSEIALIDATGGEVPVTLDQDGVWQVDDVALLDFEDGTNGCEVTGNSSLNDTVVGTVPAGTYTGVAFTIGVPDDLNHQDTTLAPSPLNLSSMFWSWQTGYKFARIDMKNDQAAPDDSWFLHLGATGCTSGGPTEPPASPCTKPNRPRIVISGLDGGSVAGAFSAALTLDAESLISGADLGFNSDGSPPGCMSNPADVVECPPIFDSLGMDFATGLCVSDCAGQVFVQ